MRPTLESLAALKKQPVASEIPPELAGAHVVSGKLDVTGPIDADLVLSGGILLRACLDSKSYSWKWRKVRDRATRSEREQWPNWDGISDGDVVTRGHIEALKDGGWLTRGAE